MTDLETIADEEQVSKTEVVEEKKDQLKSMKEFLFNLIEYTVRQTENSKTRLRIVEGQLAGEGFIMKQVQYKNGKRDFVLSEYKEGNEYVLSTARDLQPFYNLFVTKVF